MRRHMDINDILDELRLHISVDGRVPIELFYFISQYFGECCLELAIFKYINGKPHIYLIPRPEDDPIWGGMLHMPGIRKLATDTESSVLYRVIRETDLSIHPETIKYVSSQIIKNERGTEFSDLRYTVYTGDSHSGFYKVSNLPTNIIPFHYEMILSAANLLEGK